MDGNHATAIGRGAHMIPIFAGFDEREAVGYHAFCASVIKHSSLPVAITPLAMNHFNGVYDGGQKDGTNAFIYTRFLVPFLMGYRGWAIFADGADMIVKDDIAKLWDLRDPEKAVQVVPHDYQTKHPRKYIGTQMESVNEDYPMKNWSSLMLINCGHYSWTGINPTSVKYHKGAYLHRFRFIDPEDIGFLPAEWNWLADEYGDNPSAKLLHWTAGIPAWPHYKDAPHAQDWRNAHEMANHATT